MNRRRAVGLGPGRVHDDTDPKRHTGGQPGGSVGFFKKRQPWWRLAKALPNNMASNVLEDIHPDAPVAARQRHGRAERAHDLHRLQEQPGEQWQIG